VGECAAETSLDDASYDAQTAGSGGIIGGGPAEGEEPPAAAAEESSAGAVDGEKEEADGENGSSRETVQQQDVDSKQQPQKKKTQFDRLVSSVFEDAGRSGRLAKGPGNRGGGSARWQQKLSGSYLRRAVSARFAGGKAAARGKAAEEGDKQRGGAGKADLSAGKSGAQWRGSSCKRCLQQHCLHFVCHASLALLALMLLRLICILGVSASVVLPPTLPVQAA
jgi:hypothetical protein